MVQEATVPGWARPVAAALVATIAIGAVLWAFALRPAIHSEARDAAQAAVGQSMAADRRASAQQAGQIQQLQRQVDGRTPPPATASPASPGEQVDGRLTAAAGAFAVKDGMTLSVTDVVFENPNGDKGTIRLQRSAAGSGPTTDLMVLKLDNFRDVDYHFVTAIVVGPGQTFRLSVPAGSGASVYYTGFLKGT
jgi:hypothetical protein